MTEFVISSAVTLVEYLLEEKAPPLEGWEHRFLVEEKAAAVKGSEEHLQGLKTDLKFMLDFLIESSGSRNLNHLISQVSEMANVVGDIIDTFIFTVSEEMESLRVNNFLREIESIRSRFRKVNLQSPVGVEEAEHIERKREVAPWEDVEDVVVGLEKRVEMLIHKFLLYGMEERFYLMIKGMGGIGKTTLARQIYNHAIVVEQFERRGWACVSSEFQAKEVLRVLIQQVGDLDKEEVEEKMDVESLQKKLHHHLQGKRYLIVLDNVWDDTSVNHVLGALPTEDKSSRVLLTSRSSYIVNGISYFCNLDHLDFDESWQLFLKMVFTNDNKCPNHLEKIGKKLVKKCHGLPLAIKEVGRQLATKRQSESVWEEFLNSMDFTETTTSLDLSYRRLSPAEKSCFQHMSFFEEGTTIRVQKLIHIWNAAGMVTRLGESGKMEKTASMFFQKLSSKGMIMAVNYNIGTKSKKFCLDGFIHKICITKAQEEIGLDILGKEKHVRPHHRVICCSREKFNYSMNQDKHVLSLFFNGGGYFDTTPSYWESFERLTILDFEGFGLKSLGETVCGLGRLRYLGLRDNYIQELPQSLCRLKNLEVLDIALNFMIEVPNIIWEMDSLHHLYMSDIICRTPLKIDSLKYIQTLTYISIRNWTYELSNLESMTCLRKLGIEELDENSHVSNLFASLAKLEDLECLILRGFRFRSMPSLDDLSLLENLVFLKLDGRLTKLPKLPQTICSLTLVNSCLDVDPMPELEKLPELWYLYMRNAYTGQEMDFSQHDLNLETLRIGELWHLRDLRPEKTYKCHLEDLEICSCPYLSNIPREMIDFDGWNLEYLKMVTTKRIAKLNSHWATTFIPEVHIDP